MGHRGFPTRYPENTMVSFRAAVDAGAQLVELDVTLTRDGQVVVMHDDTVDRTTDGRGFVADYTLGTLKRLDAGSWFHPGFAGERVPTLKEVLEKIDTRVVINIEIKSHRTTDAARKGKVVQGVLTDVLDADAEERVLVSSFDPMVIKRVKQVYATIPVALIAERSHPVESVGLSRSLGAFSYHPDLAYLDHATVKALQMAGLRVFPYNIKEQKSAERAFALGVDGLIADDPIMARQCYT